MGYPWATIVYIGISWCPVGNHSLYRYFMVPWATIVYIGI
jgi:hypothetical protein